ncbi:unnamed protein product [Rangifer tarandus platyrhynchus]|uniref:Transmembrane protein n=1 Tax=Rangifer tarandus platyrhynchus TaxID=3082113 RepID=A0ABN8XN48_RANTA|nr:unnamed protein product [Rangifer tarandus platyrhynchus]
MHATQQLAPTFDSSPAVQACHENARGLSALPPTEQQILLYQAPAEARAHFVKRVRVPPLANRRAFLLPPLSRISLKLAARLTTCTQHTCTWDHHKVSEAFNADNVHYLYLGFLWTAATMRQRAALASRHSAGRAQRQSQCGYSGVSRGYHFMGDGRRWKWMRLSQFLLFTTLSAIFNGARIPHASLTQGSEELEDVASTFVETSSGRNGGIDSLTNTAISFSSEALLKDVTGTSERPCTEDTPENPDSPDPLRPAGSLDSPQSLYSSFHHFSPFRIPSPVSETVLHEQEEVHGGKSPAAAPSASPLSNWGEAALEASSPVAETAAIAERVPREVPAPTSEEEAGVAALFLSGYGSKSKAFDRGGLDAKELYSAKAEKAHVLCHPVADDSSDPAAEVTSSGALSCFGRPSATREKSTSPHTEPPTQLFSSPVPTSREDAGGGGTAEATVRGVGQSGTSSGSGDAAVTDLKSLFLAGAPLVQGLRETLRRRPQHEDGADTRRLGSHTRVQDDADGGSDEGVGLQGTQEVPSPFATLFLHIQERSASPAGSFSWQDARDIRNFSSRRGRVVSREDDAPSPEGSPVSPGVQRERLIRLHSFYGIRSPA